MKFLSKIIGLFLILATLLVSCYKTEDVPEGAIVEQSEFTQKLLLEDYTGTWCTNCPKATSIIEAVVANNSRYIPVAIHFRNINSPEYMQNVFTEAIVTEYHPLGGFPIIELNREETTWATDYNTDTLEAMLNRYAPVGLAIDSTLNANDLNVNIKVGFVEELETIDNYKLVVYLLESGVIYPQHDGNDIIEDYEHEHVLRYSFTNVFGDVLPSQVATNHRYSKDYDITLPSYIENNNNLSIVAFVLDKDNKCLNVQVANVGENKDFD